MCNALFAFAIIGASQTGRRLEDAADRIEASRVLAWRAAGA